MYSETEKTPRVALVIIGDEILSGRIRDANSPFLAEELHRVGAELRRIVVLPDDTDVIAGELRSVAEQHDYVITTGGIGPTHDDVTMEGVARAFDVDLEVNADLDHMLMDVYGPDAAEAARRMARVPAGARIITADDGRFPPIMFRNILILPGVPGFVRKKFPLIADRFRGPRSYRLELSVPADETTIAELLEDAAARNPDIKIGSYPVDWSAGKRRLVDVTVTGRDRNRVEEVARGLLRALPGSTLKRGV